jgi:hypothetical protein
VRGKSSVERAVFEEKLASRDAEILGLRGELQKKGIDVERLRLELQKQSALVSALQNELDDQLKVLDQCEDDLACALAELELEREDHGATKEKLQDAVHDFQQECNDHDRTAVQLERAVFDLTHEKKRHDEDKARLQDCENKLGFARYVCEFAAKLRLRWLLSHPIPRGNKGEVIREGNRAAHDANIVVDLSLLALGKIEKDSDRKGLQSIYGIDIDSYICDLGKLKELKSKSRSMELINFKASMCEELKDNTPSSMKFRKLLQDIEEVRNNIAQRKDNEEDRAKAFEDNESIVWIMKEMAQIVSNRDREKGAK